MPLPKVTYWSSSPLPVGANTKVGSREHAVLMTVKQGRKAEQTVRIATCINGAVSARIAEALQKIEANR